MKVSATLLVIIVAATITAKAQIPNRGFEDWTTVGNCLEPTGWYSFYSLVDSTGSYCPVTRSTDHYPPDKGSYSVRISNDTAIWNTGTMPGSLLGWGMLLTTKLDDRPLFPITGHPTSLRGYYKFFPQNGDTMNIAIFLFQGGVEVASGRFWSDVTVSEWTPFQVIVSDTTYLSADSARLSFSSANEPKDGSRGPLGNSVLFIDNISFDTLVTSADLPTNELPVEYCLGQNYPNPFNPNTVIRYSLPVTGYVTLSVYSVLGQEVTSLVNEIQEAGIKSVEFDGSTLPSGVYFYRLVAGNYVEIRKMELMR